MEYTELQPCVSSTKVQKNVVQFVFFNRLTYSSHGANIYNFHYKRMYMNNIFIIKIFDLKTPQRLTGYVQLNISPNR